MKITVVVKNYQGKFKRSWTTSIEKQSRDELVLYSSKRLIITFAEKPQKPFPYAAREYYFFHRWFNVFELYQHHQFVCWYINIASPPQLTNTTLSYEDYDLDFIVNPDYSVQSLDQDEFDHNKIHYPDGHTEQITQSIATMFSLIHNKRYPFITPKAA